MATTIKLKNGSGAPLAGDLVQGEPALDLTNKRLYTEDSGGTVIEVGTNPSTIDINAGTIDGTVIGGSSAAAGTFTTFTSTGIDDNATSTAITIDSSENVGIGTASPSQKMHINVPSGPVFLQVSSGSSDGFFGYDSDSGNQTLQSDTGLHFTTGASFTERMRIDSSGNVGIGTTSPSTPLAVTATTTGSILTLDKTTTATNSVEGGLAILTRTSGTAAAGLGSRINFITENSNGTVYETAFIDAFTSTSASAQKDGVLAFSTANGVNNPTERMRIDSSGNVDLYADKNLSWRWLPNDYIRGQITVLSANHMTFTTAYSERMRIDSSGNLLVGKDSTGIDDLGCILKPTGETFFTIDSTDNTLHVYNTTDNAYKFYVLNNGGVANFSSNNTNLSDQRTKKDIVDSGNYLEKLCNIPVRNFRYNEDAEDSKHHLGVISQEVEAVAPEFVNKASWEHADGPMDTVYNTDLMFAMMKSIQELSAQVTELKAEVAALKGA